MNRPTTGELRERLSIQTAIKVDDGEGGYLVSYAELGKVWAKCILGSSRQRLYHGQAQDTLDAVFIIRHQQPFTLDTRNSEDYKVVDQRDQVYRVKGVKPLDNRLDFIVLECQLWGAVNSADTDPTAIVPLGTISPDEW